MSRALHSDRIMHLTANKHTHTHTRRERTDIHKHTGVYLGTQAKQTHACVYRTYSTMRQEGKARPWKETHTKMHTQQNPKW